MALLNTGCLISTIQTDVTGITTGYAADCFTVIAAGVDGATQDRCVTVPTSGSLPSLWPTQSVPQGQVVFVEDVGVPVIAASGKWIGFDQRVFRSDLPPDRNLYAWGFNNVFAILGDGTTVLSRASPVTTAGGGTNWCFAQAGSSHTVAFKTDGTLWTWGSNCYGELGTAQAAFATSRCSPGTISGGGTNWCKIAAGTCSSFGIKTDGTLWSWGTNNRGQLGIGNTTNRCSPGTTAGGGTTWCAISAGGYLTAAIKTDGTLWTWGDNGNGQLGTGNITDRSSPGTTAGGGTTWCLVSAGDGFIGAVKTDGTLWTWGRNDSGQLGNATLTGRSSPGTVAGGGTTWCLVSAGAAMMSAIKTDGTLWTWGNNQYGSQGDGTTTARSSPGTTAGGGTTWCQVSTNFFHMAAIKTDGTLWTWGFNQYGQLGENSNTNRSSPGTVAGGGTTWRYVTTGSCQNTFGVKNP